MRFEKWIFFAILMLLYIACCTNTPHTKASIPDNGNAFGKISLQYIDPNSEEFKRIRFNLDTFYNRQQLMGFNGSVLIGYKGKVLYERYIGYSNKENQQMWTSATQSQLASTSKTLTSGAILLLKDKGLLHFDDAVQQYLPSFPYPTITIKMLLTHRSGLPDYTHIAAKPKDKAYLTNDDLVNLFATTKPKLNFTPNTHFTYCNTNYALLASIIESISGMKYKYFMERYLFTPLGMTNTFVYAPEDEKPMATAISYKYNWKIEPDMYLDGVQGDKGIYSCVQDLYKWDQTLYKHQFIKSNTLEEAYTPYSFEKPGVKNYGLGWRLLLYPDGNKIIYHNGWWHGNNTCFYRFLQDNFSIIILGNRFNRGIYQQPHHIFKIVNGIEQYEPLTQGEE